MLSSNPHPQTLSCLTCGKPRAPRDRETTVDLCLECALAHERSKRRVVEGNLKATQRELEYWRETARALRAGEEVRS